MARRASSVAPAGRRLLSTAGASLSISTSDLSGGGRPARAAPALCPQHRPPRVCQRPSCDALHVCRLYVDGFCPHGDAACRWGHAVASDDNQAALAAHQLQALPERELLWLVRALLRQTAPVAAEEYRSQLAVCSEYAADARCGRPDCFQLHLCPQLATSECRAGDSCRWSHRLTDPDNLMVLLRLRCAELSEAEVLARLAQRQDEDAGSSNGHETQTADIGSGHVSSQDRSVRNSDDWGPVRSDPGSVASGVPGISQAQLNAAVNGSSKDPKELARDINLCQLNIHPSRCEGDCPQLHMCRLFVAGMCPYADKCRSGHNLFSSHNSKVLKERELELLSEGDLLHAIKAGYLARNPITDLERRLALQVCSLYQDGRLCGADCLRLHVCGKYVAGTCPKGSGCGLSHNLVRADNAAVLKRAGLSSLSNADLLSVLKAPRNAKNVLQSFTSSSDYVVSGIAPSSDSSLPAGNSLESDGASQSVAHQATPKASENDSSKDQKKLAQDVNLCRYNIYPSRCAGDCGQLHLCRFFVAGMCPYAEMCSSGHKLLSSSHNAKVLKESGLEGLSEGELLDAIKAGYLARNPITDLERRFALRVCLPYQDGRGCGENCPRLHICAGYVAGTCANGSGCGLSHQLLTGNNATIITRVGLFSLPHKEKLEVLRDRPGAKSVWLSFVSSKDSVASSSDSSPPVESRESDDYSGSVARQATPKNSENGSSNDPRELAKDVNLCRHNILPSRCAGDCQRLHMCRLFVAGMCPYTGKCGSSHKLVSSLHNSKVLKERGLESLHEAELLDAIKAGYLARNPITDLERRFALQVCRPYHDGQDCRENCPRLHICDGYLAGTCAKGSGCGLSHQLADGTNMAIIKRVGLSRLQHKELLEVLRDPPGAKRVWLSIVSSNGSVASSSDSTDSAAAQNPTRVVRAASPAARATVDGPTLCAVHAAGGRCQRADCDGFHVCGFFLANLCRRPDNQCPLGHSFDSAHNQRVLEQHGLRGGSPEHFQALIDRMTQRAHITFPNDAENDVRMCVPYNSKAGCSGQCSRFHICHKYLGGTCSGNDCPLQHALDGSHNMRVREVLGLAATPGPVAWATERELTELLRARLGVSPGVYEEPAECARPAPAAPGMLGGSGACSGGAGACSSGSGARSGVSGGSGVASLTSVCGSLSAGRPCSDSGCSALHVCPHFLAGACRRQNCTLGHRLDTPPNRRALRLAGRAVTELNHDTLIGELYSASSNVRRSEVYNKLRICIAHNRQEGCNLGGCSQIHICQKFVAGSCKDDDCDLGHSVTTHRSGKRLRSLGLENAEVDEVLEMLRAVHGMRSACVLP